MSSKTDDRQLLHSVSTPISTTKSLQRLSYRLRLKWRRVRKVRKSTIIVIICTQHFSLLRSCSAIIVHVCANEYTCIYDLVNEHQRHINYIQACKYIFVLFFHFALLTLQMWMKELRVWFSGWLAEVASQSDFLWCTAKLIQGTMYLYWILLTLLLPYIAYSVQFWRIFTPAAFRGLVSGKICTFREEQ